MFERIRKFFRRFKLISLIGWSLLLIGIISVCIGYGKDIKGFMANLSVELISIGITILVIDTLYRQREKKEEKALLISHLGSTENLIAKQAARDLREKGWIMLPNTMLWKANLENAELYEYDLSESNLVYANLKGANLCQSIMDGTILHETNFASALLHCAKFRGAEFISARAGQFLLKDADLFQTDFTNATFKGLANGAWSEDEQHIQLQEAKRLQFATMPNEKKYDGRYNLQGDYESALAEGVDINDINLMAKFYDVSLEEYLEGQDWHKKFGKSPANLITWV